MTQKRLLIKSLRTLKFQRPLKFHCQTRDFIIFLSVFQRRIYQLTAVVLQVLLTFIALLEEIYCAFVNKILASVKNIW